ncbi:MAG: hypothetical protein QM532_01870, partial [Cyanobium sp. MAG06]|nr:hypothetical protein [Cyanobium sp. MAG06]
MSIADLLATNPSTSFLIFSGDSCCAILSDFSFASLFNDSILDAISLIRASNLVFSSSFLDFLPLPCGFVQDGSLI